MTEEIIKILRRKHSFLNSLIEGLEYAIRDLERENDPENIYNTLAVFLGEFPTKKLIQDLANEKGIKIRIRTKEDALTVLRSLRKS